MSGRKEIERWAIGAAEHKEHKKNDGGFRSVTFVCVDIAEAKLPGLHTTSAGSQELVLKEKDY